MYARLDFKNIAIFSIISKVLIYIVAKLIPVEASMKLSWL